MTTTDKPKRIGWGALLNSVKDKKRKQQSNAEDPQPSSDPTPSPPPKKIKASTVKESTESPAPKKIKASTTKEPTTKEPTTKEPTTKITTTKTTTTKETTTKETITKSTTPKETTKPSPPTKTKSSTNKTKETTDSNKTIDSSPPPKKSTASAPSKDASKTKTSTKPKETPSDDNTSTSSKKVASTLMPEAQNGHTSKKLKTTDTQSNTTPKKVKEQPQTTSGDFIPLPTKENDSSSKPKEQKKKPQTVVNNEAEQQEAKNMQVAKEALRTLLGNRQYYDFSVGEPIVVHVFPEEKPGEHDFYLDLLAKSFSNNYSSSVSYKKTKMVLGFDIEFMGDGPLTIQLSTAYFVVVFSLLPKNKKKFDKSKNFALSPGVRHMFTSADYIKCGVGVPDDMVYLQKYFNISLTGMFDVSLFAVDMQLTSAPWSLGVLGMDLLGIGKSQKFSALSSDLVESQIEYAARDAWVGYLIAVYFFDFFQLDEKQTLYKWAHNYSEKNQGVYEAATKTSQGMGAGKERKVEEEVKQEDEEDEKEEDSETVSAESIIGTAIKKGMAINKTKSVTKSNELEGIAHRIRNRLEGLKAVRVKAKNEDKLMDNLIQRLANDANSTEKTANVEDSEDVGVVYNWV